jgi:hypothetical protein
MGEILITIDKKDFSITIEGMGYKGDTCIKDISELLEATKSTVIKRKRKNVGISNSQLQKLNRR